MDDTENIEKKTALKIDENIEGALCYILGFLTGILFLLLEKENKFVRFHAMQSLITFLSLFIIEIFFGAMLIWIPVIGWMMYVMIILLSFVLWLLLMFKAYQGEKFKLPIIGKIAENQA